MAFRRVFTFISVALLLVLGPLMVGAHGEDSAASPVPIRIGWQIPAATQGQILQVLKRTQILESHGLEPVFIPFSYGRPQVHAAFSGELDVFFSGDQPAINLIARGGHWKIVGRLFEDGVGIIVPPNSPIKQVKDLKGAVVASPFGSVAHRDAFREQEAASLDPDRDVSNLNMDILEISGRVNQARGGKWDGIDAAAVWEPIISEFELDGLARSITSKRYLGVIAVSEDFIDNHPKAVVEFLIALTRSWEFFTLNPDRVMDWYIRDTQLSYTSESLIAARVDSNFAARSIKEIRLDLDQDAMTALGQAAQWALDSGEGDINLSEAIDTQLLSRASTEVSRRDFQELKIILPSTDEANIAYKDLFDGLNSAPLSIIFIVMIALAILAIEFGFRLGRSKRKSVRENQTTPIATVVGAVLAMMAFVIALTFGSANNRFDARKTALIEDVTAINTAYLRANLIPEPQRTTVRNLLRDYVQARVGIVYAYGQPDTLQLVQQRAKTLQELMWSHVETLSQEQGENRVNVLFIRALNEVFNLHTKRVVLGVYNRIPTAMWLTLIMASSVAMLAVGFQFGIGGSRRIHTAKLALAVTFALVMVLAFDLDRAGEGLIAVNQQPMIDLYEGMLK